MARERCLEGRERGAVRVEGEARSGVFEGRESKGGGCLRGGRGKEGERGV